MDHVEVDGLRIAYERAGSGPPLVLLHGGVSDGREWRRQLEELSDEFTVVAWDAPGCGASSDPPESFRLDGYADCLAAFIEALGLERPHVVGSSFGGGLAIDVYRRRPRVVRSLVLASAYAGWAGSLPSEEVDRRLEQSLRDLELPPDRFVARFIPTLFAGDVPEELVDERVRIMLDLHPAGARVMVRAFAEADLRDVLPTIRVPTLLLYGGLDVRAPVSVGRELHAAIPGSKLVIVPGAGHEVSIEAADRFNAEVRRFLHSVAMDH